MNRIVRLFFLILLMIGYSGLVVAPSFAAYKDQKKAIELYQFVSNGHVVGFSAHGMYVVGENHMLNIEFPGSEGTEPVVQKSCNSSKLTMPASVAYYNLWPGIDLVYKAASGAIVESIYTLAPGADASLIRLRYNVPVTLGNEGRKLHVKFETGIMQESAPIAWQKIGGQRIPVKVAFNLSTLKSDHGDVGFTLGQYDRAHPLFIDPVLQWNTFMGYEGDSYNEYANAIAIDSSGNIYVTGESRGDWGTPINAYAGGSEIFVAKFNNFGTLQWSTFLGSAATDEGYGIAVDDSFNVYVTGRSDATWGIPQNAHSGNNNPDIVVAKLNDHGSLQWNTFMGAAGEWDEGHAIAVYDGDGDDIYVTGFSAATWGIPKDNHAGSWDAFVFKLNGAGNLQWNTFMGSSDTDVGNDIAVNVYGTSVFVTGRSFSTWGTPINAHTGGGLYDAFVIKLNNKGERVYSTFMGSASENDVGTGIVVDGNGNVYVTGSGGDWGEPVNRHSGLFDVFVAKLNMSGVLQWNTFMGSYSNDDSRDIAINGTGDIYVTGGSDVTWGAPLNAHASKGYNDGFIAELNNSGVRQWNTFLGSTSEDTTLSIALSNSGNIYVSGYSAATWGSPVDLFTAATDAFVAKFKFVAKPMSIKKFYIIKTVGDKVAVICL